MLKQAQFVRNNVQGMSEDESSHQYGQQPCPWPDNLGTATASAAALLQQASASTGQMCVGLWQGALVAVACMCQHGRSKLQTNKLVCYSLREHSHSLPGSSTVLTRMNSGKASSK